MDQGFYGKLYITLDLPLLVQVESHEDRQLQGEITGAQ